MLNFSAWNQKLALNISTAAQSIFNKDCSGAVTIQALRSGTPYVVSAPLSVSLSGPANLTFYSDRACTIAVTSATIASGSSSQDVFFIDLANASATITASSPLYKSISQTETFSSNGFVWTGAVSAAWATAGNWSGNAIPTATSRVVFDGTCSPNCSPTFSGAVSVKALRMSTGYSGAIAQNAFDITIGTGGFVQVAGTFTGTTNPANNVIINDGLATIAGGTFAGPAGMFTVTDGWTVLNSPTVTWPSGSTLKIYCTSAAYCFKNTITVTPSTISYQNVTFSGRRTTYDLNAGTMTVLGNLQFGEIMQASTINNGTLMVGGDVSATTALGNYGDALIVLTGNAAGQTVSGTLGEKFPKLEVAAGANPVTISGTIRTKSFVMTSVGTFTTTGSTLNLLCVSGWSGCSGTTSNLVLGSVTYNNLTINGYSTNWNLGGTTVTVSGDFSFGDTDVTPSGERINNGTINVTGDIISTGYGDYGTANIVAKGKPAGQTITGVSGRGFPALVIDAGANPVTLSGEIRTSDYTYSSSGAFTATGTTLYLFCNTTVNTACDSVTKVLTFGAVTYNNLTFGGYSTDWDLNGGTVTVAGNLIFGDSDASPTGNRISNGTLNVTGNITATSYGHWGSAWIVATGTSSSQTVTGVAGKGFPRLKIDAGTNSVTLSGEIRTVEYNYVSSGAFSATGSTITFYCSSTINLDCADAAKSLAFGGVTYNNITFSGYSTAWDLGGGTITIAGNFTFGDTDSTPSSPAINNATLNVGGDVTQTNSGPGNATVVLTGNPLGQTVTGIANKRFLPLQINTGANPVTISGTIVTANYSLVSAGTLITTGSTLQIACNSTIASCATTTATINPGTKNYNNVIISGYQTIWDLGGATFKVTGNLTMGDQNSNTLGQIQNGTLQVSGNTTITSVGNSGNAALNFVGTAPQTITGNYKLPSGLVTINQSGAGALRLGSTISWNTAGQSLTLTAGSIDMMGFNMTVNNVLTIGLGTTLTKSGGTLVQGSLVNNGTLNP